MNIASNIINKCGGVSVLAEWTGLTTKSVYCWTYDKPKGTGGIIPAKYHSIILDSAKQKRVPLEPSDFFAPSTN